MATKAKSKSVEKREAVQIPNPIAALEFRIEQLEAKQALVSEGFQFVADETRGLFGLAPIALVFDAIAKKLR